MEVIRSIYPMIDFNRIVMDWQIADERRTRYDCSLELNDTVVISHQVHQIAVRMRRHPMDVASAEPQRGVLGVQKRWREHNLRREKMVFVIIVSYAKSKQRCLLAL